jgi:predicted GIY-YIG superfamily endonuclease
MLVGVVCIEIPDILFLRIVTVDKKFTEGHMTDYNCYLLRSAQNNRTYIGITNNFEKRLRQHNGEIKGGSKYCLSNGAGWSLHLLVGGFESKGEALKFEWAAKHDESRKNVIFGITARAQNMRRLVQEKSLQIVIDKGAIGKEQSGFK